MPSFDMGGTTAKACVIDEGEPLVARELEVARADRFGVAIEALNWRTVRSGPPPDFSMETSAQAVAGPGGGAVIKKRRPAYFAEAAGYVDTPVYDRYRLTPGTRLDGPAIIEERESTTVIGPGARVVVDARLTLIAEPAA